MRRRLIQFTTIIGFCLIGASVSSMLPVYAIAQDVPPLAGEDKLDAIETLASRIKTNYQSIRTWQGAYQFEEKKYVPAEQVPADLQKAGGGTPAWQVATGIVRFAIDLERDSLFTFYEQTSDPLYVSIVTEKPFGASRDRSSWQSVLIPEHWLNLKTRGHWGQFPDHPEIAGLPLTGDRVVMREPAAESHRHVMMGIVFDPRDLFSNGSHIVWKELEATASAIRGERAAAEKQWVMENNIVFREQTAGAPTFLITERFATDEDTDHLMTRSTFDSRFGLNPVEYSLSRGDGIRQRRAWEYEKKDGVYLPIKFVFDLYDAQTGQLRFSRTLTMQESILNEPIPPETFTIKQFGLKQGDRYLDKIGNDLKAVWDDELVSIAEYNNNYKAAARTGRLPGGIAAAPQGEPQRSRPAFRWLLWANAAVVVLVGSVLAVRWLRRRSA